MTKKSPARLARDASPAPVLQERQIKIGSKSLTLHFGIRAMMTLRDCWAIADDPEEVQNRKSADQKLAERLDNPSLEDFVTVLWAATRTFQPELTEEEVLDILDKGGMDAMTELKTQLGLTIAAGRPPVKADQNPPRATR